MQNLSTLHDFLDSLGEELTTLLQPSDDARHGNSLWAAAGHVTLAAGAKRSRPTLVYRFGGALNVPAEARLDVAVAAELIHAASLVHDDVIDKGTLRRGRSTVNVEWNNVTAVLTGDLMFSLAFRSLHPLPRPVMNTAVDVLLEMTQAAIQEVEARGNLSLSLDRWRKIASGKTGALFGWCGSAVARAVENEKAALAFEHCGRELGVAFQLGDDLKDFAAGEGKDAFADLKNKNPNFPILWGCQKDEGFQKRIEALWEADTVTQQDAQVLGEKLIELGAPAACLRELENCIESALAALGPLREQAEIQEVEAWAKSLLKSTFADQASSSLVAEDPRAHVEKVQVAL